MGAQQATLFSLNFANPAITPETSGVTSVQSLPTSYGNIKFLDLAIHNTSKIYHGIEIFGWIEFRTGSDAINSTNSYIELPPLTFVNGGTFYINYGAGSTSRQLQLQEWNGSAWVNGSYAEVNTVASSTWYQQNWVISGAGTKIFRLVMSSASPMNVTEIDVTGNLGSIAVDCGDTIPFGKVNINKVTVIKSFKVTGNYLTSNISIDPTLPYKVSTTQTGAYYSSLTIPSTGGTVFVKYQPTAIAVNNCTLTLSSTGAISKVIILTGEGVQLSALNQITSFSVMGQAGVIDETNKAIKIIVPSNTDLSLPYTPTVALSAKATLQTTGAKYFVDGVPITYTVQAEDGTLSNYSITVIKISALKQITSFSVIGQAGVIDETNKTIVVTVPSNTNLSLPYTPTVAISAKATLLTKGATYFAIGVPVTYTVQAEDGTLCDYQITVNTVTRNAEANVTETRVYANKGIVLETEYATDFKVYSVAGALLYEGTSKSGLSPTQVSVIKGVYVVIIEGKSYKVIVK